MSQQTYTQNFVEGQPGLPYGTQQGSTDAKSAEVALDFGRVVVLGSADHQCNYPSSAGQTPLGLSVRSEFRMDRTDSTSDVLAGDPTDVARQGEFYVRVEDAVAEGGAVYFRHTASGGNTDLGALRSDDDTSTADLLPGARFIRAAAAGEVAVVSINLP